MQGSAGWREQRVNVNHSEGQFIELLQTHRRIVGSVSHAYGRAADERKDLAQDITAQAWGAFSKFDSTRSFSTWLYRIALNVAISHARARRFRDDAQEPLPDDDALTSGAATAPPDDRIRLMHRFIAQLDPLNRALVLMFLEGHTHTDMAEVLGLTETNVATKLTRVKQRLREMNQTPPKETP